MRIMIGEHASRSFNDAAFFVDRQLRDGDQKFRKRLAFVPVDTVQDVARGHFASLFSHATGFCRACLVGFVLAPDASSSIS